jgi:hypothetical protein
MVLGARPFTSPSDQEWLSHGQTIPNQEYVGAVYTSGPVAVAGNNALPV